MRKYNIEDIKSNAWLSIRFNKLNKDEKLIVLDFMAKNGNCGRVLFEDKINRLFMDRNKPKNWTLIMEILSCLNSMEPIDRN